MAQAERKSQANQITNFTLPSEKYVHSKNTTRKWNPDLYNITITSSQSSSRRFTCLKFKSFLTANNNIDHPVVSRIIIAKMV